MFTGMMVIGGVGLLIFMRAASLYYFAKEFK